MAGTAPRHPYAGVPRTRVWARAMHADIGSGTACAAFWQPGFAIVPGTEVAALGSCFAARLMPWFRAAGLSVTRYEQPPPGMSPASAAAFGYGPFPCRTGTILTSRQLRQLVADSIGGAVRTGDVWWRGGRAHDALRPGVEPEGCESAEEVMALRRAHLAACARMFAGAGVLVLTLGGVEAWRARGRDTVWPVAPGVLAGRYEPDLHEPVCLGFAEVLDDLGEIRRLLQQINPGLRLLLSVSPVPLAATARPMHVLAASIEAKAILRAAVADFAARHADVDYFPALEIAFRPGRPGGPFGADGRGIRPEVVAEIMSAFCIAQGLPVPPPSRAASAGRAPAGHRGIDADLLECVDLIDGTLRA